MCDIWLFVRFAFTLFISLVVVVVYLCAELCWRVFFIFSRYFCNIYAIYIATPFSLDYGLKFFLALAVFLLPLYSLDVPKLLRKRIQCAIQMRYNDDDYYYVLVVWQSSNGFWLFARLLGAAAEHPFFLISIAFFENSLVHMLKEFQHKKDYLVNFLCSHAFDWICHFYRLIVCCLPHTQTLILVVAFHSFYIIFWHIFYMHVIQHKKKNIPC